MPVAWRELVLARKLRWAIKKHPDQTAFTPLT